MPPTGRDLRRDARQRDARRLVDNCAGVAPVVQPTVRRRIELA
jgi:hypothetical protein